ncbi:MAG: hypothetical protein JWP14_380 [Frankiales bacterium]|nr:hypothetical protein [Frankiales bacterium]
MTSVAPVPVDPNWLLSTEAQSAAALVAIIGGFLVSRLVSLSSEREGLRRRRREVTVRRNLTSEEHQRIHGERFGQSRARFIDHHLRDVAQASTPPAAESLLDWIPRGSSTEEMRPVAEGLIEQVAEARTRILLTYPDAGPAFPPKDAQSLKGAGVEIPNGLARVYEEVADWIAAIRRSARPRSFVESAMSAYNVGVIPPLSTANPAMQLRLDALVRQEGDLASEVTRLGGDLALIDAEIQRAAQPRFLRLAFGVLSYFSLVGVLLPLFLMTRRPVPSSPTTRSLVVFAFVSGLVALLAYVVLALRDLRSNEPER